MRVKAFIGPYRVIKAIGAGGMGDVYLCEQLHPIRRRVAVKMLRPGLDSARVLERFRTEPQWLALMEHSGIARVFDVGEQEKGPPYFVMEYVSGVSITVYCRERQLGITQRVELLIGVCEAVQHAHQKGVVHLDLKPSNILVSDVDGQPQPKIIDFGVARSTHDAPGDQGFVASPAYMSPEQASLDSPSVDARTDIYTLGATLYELLTGRTALLPQDKPLPLSELRELLNAHAPIPPSDAVVRYGSAGHAAECGLPTTHALSRKLRGELDWIVLKALAAEPARRYATAAELAADLQRWLAHKPVLAAKTSRWYCMRKLFQRHLAISVITAVLAGTLLFFSSFSGWQAWQLAEERDRAELEALKARESTEFMVDMLALGNPVAGYGRDLTVEQALDIGLQRMETESVLHPEVRAELLYNVGRVYAGIGLPTDAERLLLEVLEDTTLEARLRHAAEFELSRARLAQGTPHP